MGFVLYNAGRLAIEGHEDTARHHADLVHRFQATINLPSEATIQRTLTGAPELLELANRYYVTAHFPVMMAFLVWGFLARPRPEYTWARNLLVTITFLALAIHLAPPRMFPSGGSSTP